MNTRIDGFIQPTHRHETEGTSRQESGSWNGTQVNQKPDAMSLIADAAEELSFGAQETEEKSISERKLKDSGTAERFAKVEKLLERTEDLHKSDLQRLLDTIKTGKALDQAIQNFNENFPDPTHRHAALSYLLENLTGEEFADARATLQKSIAALMEAEGPAVLAGYNIAGVHGDSALGGEAALRGLYRGTVLDYQSLMQTFDALADKYNGVEFSKAVAFLMRALGADMNATTPSTPMAALKTIMDDLYSLEILKNFFLASEELLRRLEKRYGKKMPAKPRDIMTPVLRLKDERFIQPSQLTATMPFLVSANPEQDVHFTQGLKENVRQLPHKIFDNDDKRQNLLGALQELLDTAIDREEGIED